MGMTDFHSHILPGVDDGSKHVEMSLQLLKMEQEQGVDTIILTPHFYASQNSLDAFLERRAQAWEKLQSALPEGSPRLLLGAEVNYFEGLSRMEAVNQLCIQGTDVLLLEMPFRRWDDRLVQTLIDMSNAGNVRIVLAHIERYLRGQRKNLWQDLRNAGIMAQVNTTFFEGFFSRRKALSMLEEDLFQVIGSDCHNLSERKPDWSPVPEEAMERANEFAKGILF